MAQLRQAIAADIPALAALHAASFGEAKWHAVQISNSLVLPTNKCWVAVDGDMLKGFILCQHAGDEAEILTFCVSPEARRQHLGTSLLAAAVEQARVDGAKSLFLEVAEDNRPALIFYEKAGFRVSGKRINYYQRGDRQIDALMLMLDL